MWGNECWIILTPPFPQTKIRKYSILYQLNSKYETLLKLQFLPWQSRVLRLHSYQNNNNTDMKTQGTSKTPCGRPVGWRKSSFQYLQDYADELDLMCNHSLREVSKITKTSTTTLLKLKKMFKTWNHIRQSCSKLLSDSVVLVLSLFASSKSWALSFHCLLSLSTFCFIPTLNTYPDTKGMGMFSICHW